MSITGEPISSIPVQPDVPLSRYLLVIERQLHPLRLHRVIHDLSELTGGPIFLRQQSGPETLVSTITVHLPVAIAPLELLTQLKDRFEAWRISIHMYDIADEYGDRVYAFTCPACGAWALHREQHQTLSLGCGTDDDDIEYVEISGWVERCGEEECDFAACEPLSN